MNEYYSNMIKKYSKKGVLLDSNILLLYFVGSINIDLIRTFKRTNIFTKEDYYTLIDILRLFDIYVTTPNILTEVSNLSNQLTGKYHTSFYERMMTEIKIYNEYYISSKDISSMNEFNKFGLTDTGIIKLVPNKFLVLSIDFPLCQFLEKMNVDVINFNNIRIINWK